jgi:hypothetical protein
MKPREDVSGVSQDNQAAENVTYSPAHYQAETTDVSAGTGNNAPEIMICRWVSNTHVIVPPAGQACDTGPAPSNLTTHPHPLADYTYHHTAKRLILPHLPDALDLNED